METEKEKTFFELLDDASMHNGKWAEYRKSTIIHAMMHLYKTEIIKEYHITDVIISGDIAIVHWNKRYASLSNEELKEKYGR